MAGGQVRKMWEKLLSPFQQVDKRQLQHEIDTYRLFLLTSYNRLGASGGEKAAMEIQSVADNMPFTTQQAEVQNNVQQQIFRVAEVLDNILLKSPNKSGLEPTKPRSGLSFAIGGVTPQTRAEIAETHPLSQAEVSAILQERLGFTLECRQSQIQHEEAGVGLFICGKAEPGTVVSMYPGVIYAPSQYRYMQGYPRVDSCNPYLISRYDGLIVDGKPWGRGGQTRDWWDGTNLREPEVPDQAVKPLADLKMKADETAAHRGRQVLLEAIAGAEKRVVPIRSAILERRNPLALGHFANHPPKTIKPNVMICAYSVNNSNEVIRPYIPNVVLEALEEQMERKGILWLRGGGHHDELADKQLRSEIRTLVLVATRTVEDEELMLNYRLSSHIKRPAWFHSVDEEEDQRRWE